MGYRRTLRTIVVGVVLVLGAGACEPPVRAPAPPPADAAPPWYCRPTASNSVTGLGMGTVNFYAGRIRKSLPPAQCEALAGHMAEAKAFAAQYPTRGSAEAAGFQVAFEFFDGMGTHHGRSTLAEDVIGAPGFDRHDPILPGTATFDPGEPNFLQYEGYGPDARLVGMSWYIRSATGKPPAGFAGEIDWWHHHPRLCVSRTESRIVGINWPDSSCTGSQRVNLNMERYYMLHLWVVEDLEHRADVFAPTHPCIRYGGTVFDMDDPCHDVPDAPTPRRRAAAGTTTLGYCPIGTNLAPR